jgi:hypothetical protein
MNAYFCRHIAYDLRIWVYRTSAGVGQIERKRSIAITTIKFKSLLSYGACSEYPRFSASSKYASASAIRRSRPKLGS